MSKAAAEHIFTGDTTPITSYDSTKTNLGSFMRQISLGANAVDKFVGPFPVQVGIVGEQSTGIASNFVHAIQVSDTEQWVFYAENATASATRRIGAYKFNIPNNTLTWQGFITLTYPPTTNHTVRGLRVTRDLYTTGTVGVAATAVTGSGTAWQTARLAVGARIGFGSTDPTQITTWYQISAIGSDSSITLSASAGTIAAGTPFVIEELRVLTATTNATATNGGLFVTKGLRIEAFTLGGTTVPAATTVDNIRAVYWLADASTVTNDVIGGVGLEDKLDDTTQYAYCLEGSGTSVNIYKYNIRAALTLTSGKATNAFVLATGAQTVVGNVSQNNNGRVGILQHGAGAGILCFYFVTTTRVYRVPLTNITSGNVTFVADSMQEVPPGGTASYAVTAALTSLEISTVMDRLLVTSTVARAYLTQYRTDGSQMDRMLFADDRQIDGAASSANLASGVSVSGGTTLGVWIEGGILYALRMTTSAGSCQLYVVPLGADWDFAAVNNERVITPKILTPGATKYYRVLINELRRIGSDLLGRAPEPFRVYFRTAGIDDNTGGWTAVDTAGSLDGVAAAASIQFMFEFRVAAGFCIPGRIHGLAVIYDADDSLPSELVWNLADSSNTDGTVGFTQEAAFSVLPTLTITYRRVDTDAVVLTQASGGNTYGTFEYWSGSAWVSGVGTNTVGLRRRFVPTAGLPTGVDVYAKIVAS